MGIKKQLKEAILRKLGYGLNIYENWTVEPSERGAKSAAKWSPDTKMTGFHRVKYKGKTVGHVQSPENGSWEAYHNKSGLTYGAHKSKEDAVETLKTLHQRHIKKELKEAILNEETIHVGYRNSKGVWVKTSTHKNIADAEAAMAKLEKSGKKGVQHRYDNEGSIDPGAMMTYTREEAGRLDEISRDTLSSYLAKAPKDLRRLHGKAGQQTRVAMKKEPFAGINPDAAKSEWKKVWKLNTKADRRSAGITKAKELLRKESYGQNGELSESTSRSLLKKLVVGKHSTLGRIKRHHELKGKVDSTWRDAVDAEKTGNEKLKNRSFEKHVRYTNLERPGTWRKVKENNDTLSESAFKVSLTDKEHQKIRMASMRGGFNHKFTRTGQTTSFHTTKPHKLASDLEKVIDPGETSWKEILNIRD